MVCTLFADDPVSTEAYAIFGAQIDLFLGARGHCRWADLDITEFLNHAARTPAEAVTLCCMLSTLLPWLARADDISRAEADALLRRVLEACPRDADAETFVHNSIGALERHSINAAELRH